MVHSEIMLFEIIYLFCCLTESDAIEMDKLREAFNTLLLLLDKKNRPNYDFYNELDNFMDKYPGVLEIEDEIIYIVADDLEDVYNCIIDSFNGNLSFYDVDLQYVVQDMSIYQALDIKDPTLEYQYLIEASKVILKWHVLLAKRENNGVLARKYLFLLAVCFEQFHNLISQINVLDEMKIRALLAFNSAKDGISYNLDWYVALFYDNPLKYNILCQSLINYFINPLSKKVYDDSLSEDKKRFSFSTDKDYFLAYLIILLDEFIPITENEKIREILNVRKHLLMAINPQITKLYLETGNLKDVYLTPLKSTKNYNNCFSSFYPAVLERISDFDCEDLEVDEHKMANMIISSLFIRTFIDLIFQDDLKQKVTSSIISSKFYKNDKYKISSSLCDSIIFSQNNDDILKK